MSAHILTFAVEWLSYGGGSAEDIFVSFGLTPTEFFTRLRIIATEQVTAPDTREALLELCRQRLCPETDTPLDETVRDPT